MLDLRGSGIYELAAANCLYYTHRTLICQEENENLCNFVKINTHPPKQRDGYARNAQNHFFLPALMVAPKGKKASFMSLKDCRPTGMPMMVMQQRIPETR